MFNLVLTVITFAFLGLGAFAALHADGGALLLSFERMSDKTTLVRLVNNAQQIGAAQNFHIAVKGTPADSPETLVQKGFLKSIPEVPSGMEGIWTFDESRQSVLLAFASDEDEGRFSKRICGMAPDMGGFARISFSGAAPKSSDLKSSSAIFGCAEAQAQDQGDVGKTWFIHGF